MRVHVQAYQNAVKGTGITMSLSRAGAPALVEQTVRDYSSYYNSIRMQTKLTNQSPIHFRRWYRSIDLASSYSSGRNVSRYALIIFVNRI